MPTNRARDSLVEGIRGKSIAVCVIGLGYVGLPTALVVGSSGFRVHGVDIKQDVVTRVARGEDSSAELGLRELLAKLAAEGRLDATKDLAEAMKESHVVFICVQTPVTKGKTPDLSFLEKAIEGVGRNLRAGMLIILSSTVPPGTTKRVITPLLERLTGLKLGVDFWLAHAPERISAGAALRSFSERTRLIGGVDAESGALGAEFLRAIGVKRVVEGKVGAVEVAKTAENTFRDVNIALANELALICEEAGVDVYEAIRLANTHERVSIHQPGVGVGGPCLTKDPYLLLTPAKGKALDSQLIQEARLLNDSMPRHLVELIERNLKELDMSLAGCLVGVLGVAFRGGTEDTRNSPAEKIIKGLLKRKARVISFDPLSMETFGSERTRNAGSLLSQAHCLVITSDHVEFKQLSIPTNSRLRLVVDGRRMLDPLKIPRGIRYVAVGDLTHSEREESTHDR